MTELLTRGANVSDADLNGPVVIWASVSGHTGVVEALVGRGADVNAADGDGKAYQHAREGRATLEVHLHAREGEVPAREASRDRLGAEQLALVPLGFHEPGSDAARAGGAGGAGAPPVKSTQSVST